MGRLITALIFFLLLANYPASATDCTGSLGDPIVNVTFGAGTGYGSALPSNTTSNLQYIANECPSDGYYSIVNYTPGCFRPDTNWHTLSDHTGNQGGYFMLVNASFQPSNFYIQTISGLCEGTTYQFAAWLLNMCRYKGILPNITLTIEKTDGTVLQSYDTGDIPMIVPATWKQYGFFFTTPAGVSSVVLRMRNNAPGGTGNDVALDDITFRPAGAAVTISVVNATGATILLCTQAARQLQFTSKVESCYPATAYQWQLSTDSGASWRNIPGATAATYTRPVSGVGIYLYRLAVAPLQHIGTASCRTASEPVRVIVLDAPQPNLPRQAELCTKDTLRLDPGRFDGYLWQDGSVQSTFVVKQAGTYAVTVTNVCGTGNAAVEVRERSCEIYFPSAFTPNRDGRNDVFRGLNVFRVRSYHLAVFNRWGQKVFETTDDAAGWDGTVRGTPAVSGLYTWYCTVDHPTRGNMHLKGTVLLLR